MATQWRMVGTFNGLLYSGLDYSVLNTLWDLVGIAVQDRARVFAQLGVLERAAMPILNGAKK